MPEHLLPQVFDAGRVLTDEKVTHPVDGGGDGKLHAEQRAFAEAGDVRIRLDSYERPVSVQARLLVAGRTDVPGLDVCDFH